MSDIKLKVMEALQEEAYKGVVRIDSETMHQIGVRPGDIVEIEGNRKTVAIVDRAYPTDIGQNVIRMDGIMRRNARTGIGELVSVNRAEIKEAKSVTLAPAQKGIVIQTNRPEIFKRGLLGRAVVKGDLLVVGGTNRRKSALSDNPFFEDIFDILRDDFQEGFGFSGIRFVVANTSPAQPILITESTTITINPKAVDISEENVLEVTYEDIGGLDEEVKKIREMVELPLRHPEIFRRLGISPPAGVLLHGSPGTGKTLIAKAVANESDANFVLVNGPEIINKYYGESEKRLRDIFDESQKNAPSIIFIDEIDAIAPKREETYGEVERRVVATLLTLLDGLKERGRVVVIAATNRPNAIDPALRRPGRFDREIQVGVPDQKGRLNILKIHTRNMPLTKDVKLKELASVTHGFVGADIASLAKEAAMNVLRRLLPRMKVREKEPIPKELLDELIITSEDFKEALRNVRPSAMREVLVETPELSWVEIGGLSSIKQELKEAVEWPINHPKAFSRIGVRPPRGLLLYGPPGTGKTLLAKAVAHESQSNFILVKGPELLDKYVGESEKGIRKIFEKARQVSPTIIFFDEMDAIAPRRGQDEGSKVTERVVNTLLSEMDGLEEMTDIVVIGATNRPDILDPALLRPGRFDRVLLVSPPMTKGREKIFEIHTKEMKLDKDVNLKKLAKQTVGYVGADIESLCREAGMLALREDIKAEKISMKHFNEAMNKVRASVSPEDLERYKSVEAEYLKSAKAALKQRKEIEVYTG